MPTAAVAPWIRKLSNPTADGWVFGGWFTDKDCKKGYDFSTPVTSDLTLYAKWAKAKSGPKSMPQTGDLTMPFMVIAEAGLASTCAAALLRRKRRQ